MALRMTDEFPRKLILVGIEPASLAPSISLSDIGEKSMEIALEHVVNILRGIQISVTPKEATS